MGKKDKKSKEDKKARAAEKQKKNNQKAESKQKKQAKKSGEDEEEDQDIDAILEQYAKEQEELLAVKVDVVDRPSKRLNPAMVASPLQGKRELLLFGGEANENGMARFYNDLHTYTIDNNTWRRYTSKNAPLPRSSHAMCAHPSGIVVMFGGEFSSPKQSTFYHYGDTWVLDAETKEWEKIDQKKGPSARSGHRMCVWKHYIILHGGFRDLGVSTTYLHDMWLFDITTHKWTQAEFPPAHPVPDARSGHSMVPHPEGAVIYGGYCKVKGKKGSQKGKVLTDTWLVKMKADPKGIRFERRRKQGFSPSPRVGCSMVFHKNRGIMFGGVYDYDESDEKIESQFYNTLQSYQVEVNRWYNLTLKPRKKKKQEPVKEKNNRDEDLEDILNSILAKANLNDDDEETEEVSQIERLKQQEEREEMESDKVEFPVVNQLPHPRFNATACVADDSLYIFGGIFERGEQEFNLDSMYSIDLNKLDGVKVFWEDHSELDKTYVSSDDEGDDDDEEDDEEEEPEEAEEEEEEEIEEEEEEEENEDEIPDPRPWLPHPKPFENLRAFYIRTGAQFLEWSISSNRDARGKYLKKAAFDLCEDRFWERREQVRMAEDQLEELGGVGEVIEKDTSKSGKRR
ncbi:uncharacterized protein CXQ87_004932 [Candidozyma duobushaemuli]|uniref:DUF4110 domain-containing protein n=1 Tax=Candidozyma duobushaemuli TaxID=1231522 RepID=A0A2V1AE77_9ASCO|nr:uncharacterized protein CXQ87_004932 [[Candida] duobushaemulonis]PVH16637.1 hypothetical protein CXQ87_004932 [[Candida] duobushaemulonis]